MRYVPNANSDHLVMVLDAVLMKSLSCTWLHNEIIGGHLPGPLSGATGEMLIPGKRGMMSPHRHPVLLGKPAVSSSPEVSGYL